MEKALENNNLLFNKPMIQDEFTGLYYDPTAITNNLIKIGDQRMDKINLNKKDDLTTHKSNK